MPSATQINRFLARLEKRSQGKRDREYFIYGKSIELPWIKTYGWASEDYITREPKREPATGDSFFVVAQNLSAPAFMIDFNCKNSMGKIEFGDGDDHFDARVYAISLPSAEPQPADAYTEVRVANDVSILSEAITFKATATRIFDDQQTELVDMHLVFRFSR